MNKSRSRFLSCHPLAILISIKHIPTNHCYATFFIPTFPIGALISMFASQMGWQGWIFLYHLSRGGIQTYISRVVPTDTFWRELFRLSYCSEVLYHSMITLVSSSQFITPNLWDLSAKWLTLRTLSSSRGSGMKAWSSGKAPEAKAKALSLVRFL